MPEPLAGDLHVDGLLSQISIASYNQAEDYVADKVFPIVPVGKQSDKYTVYDDGWFQADEGDSMRRAPGTEAHETGYKVTNTASYYCEPYAIGKGIPDEDRDNADAIFNLDFEATELVTQLTLLRRELAFATDFMTTSVWNTDVTGGSSFTKWSDYGASDPLYDVEEGKRVVYGNINRNPNKLVIGDIVWRRLKYHPDIVDRVKYGGSTSAPARVTLEAVTQLLELEEILIGRASRRSSNEGAAVTKARVIDDDALLLWVPARPGKYTPSGGYTFVWSKRIANVNMPQFIMRYREDRKHRDVIECHTYFDQKVTATKAGYFFSDVTD